MAGHEAGDGHDVEEHDHEQGDGEDEVLEELEELGELLVVLLALSLVLASEELAHVTGESVADAVEVADSDVVGAGQLVDERLAQGRQGRAADTKDHAAENNGDEHRGAEGDEDQGEDAGEVQEVLASKEDRLERGDLGEDQVHDEAENHDQGDLGAVGVQGEGRSDLNLSHDAGDLEGAAEHVGENGDLSAHGVRTNVEDKEADDGLHGTREDVHSGLLLQQEADQGDDAHDDGGVPELHENSINHAILLSAKRLLAV